MPVLSYEQDHSLRVFDSLERFHSQGSSTAGHTSTADPPKRFGAQFLALLMCCTRSPRTCWKCGRTRTKAPMSMPSKPWPVHWDGFHAPTAGGPPRPELFGIGHRFSDPHAAQPRSAYLKGYMDRWPSHASACGFDSPASLSVPRGRYAPSLEYISLRPQLKTAVLTSR